MNSTCPTLNRPPDFAAFWEGTEAELVQIDPDILCQRQGMEGDALRLENLIFSSLGGKRISGYMIRWTDELERPLVVHSHGYDGRFEPLWGWARMGVNVIGVQVRGYGNSYHALPARSPWGYVLTGIDSPQEYVLRGAVCDYLRAAEVGESLLKPYTSRTILQGTSFAGGLAVMAEAIVGVADFLSVAVPSLGWAQGRRMLAHAGSGGEINKFLARYPEQEEHLMTILSYFDPMNFAGRVHCPTLIGVGLSDEVVPAPTVYAIADNLAGPREVIELPVSHSTLPEERLWEDFEAYWLRLAVDGVPESFGKTKR